MAQLNMPERGAAQPLPSLELKIRSGRVDSGPARTTPRSARRAAMRARRGRIVRVLQYLPQKPVINLQRLCRHAA
jgi:hypothetical protein